MIRKVGSFLAAILFSVLFLAGCLCIAWPFVAESVQSHESSQAIADFQAVADVVGSLIIDTDTTEIDGETESEDSAADSSGETSDSSDDTSETYLVYEALRAAMEEYNQRIYEEGQSGLVDAWSYQQASFDLSDYGIDSEMIGYITIPSMDSVLPIYLGATTANMRKGAVNLGQTSLPIGGENTNCVLAAHRGYSGMAFWRDIEAVSVGDYVYVTNLWEELTYQVTSIEIIYPYDIDKILIQDGKDMLTLITCHPYGGNGIYRYVVYCERVESRETATESEAERDSDSQSVEPEVTEVSAEADTASNTTIITPEGYTFESSQNQIELEQNLQRIGIIIVSILLAGILIALIRFMIKGRKQPDGKHIRRA